MCKEMLRKLRHDLEVPAVTKDDVRAAILMTQSGLEPAKIIAIASGTKYRCYTADESVVSDCHAEMLVRRCLISFLFKQLEIETPSSIFTKSGEKYSLKEQVHFHLFVNKIPCGDACIQLGSKKESRLRFKKIAGEGNVLNTGGDLSNFKMCCSEKIALWNVVGVQGAHLSQFLTRPVYLSTILVKGLLHLDQEAQLKRAFYGRLKEMDLKNLPSGYGLNEPVIVGVVGETVHATNKQALCWVDGKGELINGSDGTRAKGILDISKQGIHNAYPQWPFRKLEQKDYRTAEYIILKQFKGDGRMAAQTLKK